MSVQPELDSGYVDYSSPGAVPNIADTPGKGNYAKDLSPNNSIELYPHKYRGNNRPTTVNVNFWGKNGYYMNGPRPDPMTHAQSQRNQVLSYTEGWTSQAKISTLNSFSKLLNKYGNTNSPGTLWAIANSNFNADDPVIQKVLSVDAKVAAEQYGQSQPVRAAAPASTEDASWTDAIWRPLEFASRNIFAGLSMPMEAVQGAARGIGGQLTEETGPDYSGAFAMLGSLIVPPIALWADRVRGDNEFINPWEQTEFGQTLLSAAGGAGFSAFTTKQAGLDMRRAKDELLLDPKNKELLATAEGRASLDYMAENLAKDRGYYSDPGWFIDETSVVGEAQRQATFQAWAIPGPDDQLTAWTLGRGIFSNVGGPDWVGYGTASGLVDATAAIFTDPTIIGAKFGVVSKSIRGLSTILRGADGAILVGKERKAAEEATVLALRQLRKAQSEAADASYMEEFNKAASRLRADLGRVPTTSEIEAIVGKRPTPDVADLTDLDADSAVSLIKQQKSVELTTETLKSISPDLDFVNKQARNLRRSIASSLRATGILAKDTVKGEVDPAARDLWNSYMQYSFVKRNGEYELDSNGFYEFTKRFLGYDEASGQFTNLPAKQMFEELSRREAAMEMAKTGPRLEAGTREAAKAVLDDIDRLSATQVRKAADIPADQVERDAARILTDDNTPLYLDGLKAMDSTGASLAQAPQPGMPVLSIVDGKEAVTYWTAAKAPKLAAATDAVPTLSRVTIKKQMLDILERPDMRFADTYDDVESLAGQVATKIDVGLDARAAFNSLMSVPNLTWGQLYNEVVRIGLDGVFDDMIRSLPKKEKIDGIAGLLGVADNGVWLGDHPSLVAYEISPTAKEAAVGIKGSDDIEAALANLDVTAATQIPLGYRTIDPAGLEELAASSLSKAGKQLDGLRNYRADMISKAVIEDAALKSALESLDARFADPIAALKETIGYEAGMRASRTGGLTLDERGIRSFLFGSGPMSFLANKVFDVLSDFIPESERIKALDAGIGSDEYRQVLQRAMGELHLITNGKWGSDAYRAVAENAIVGGGREGLMRELAPRLGIDITKGSISRTTQLVDTDGKRYFRSWRSPSPAVARALGRMPTQRKINLQNADEVTESIMLYARYAKVDEARIANLIGKVLDADGTMEAVGVNRNALADAFDDVSEVLLARIAESGTAKALFSSQKGKERLEEIKQSIRSSTRLWLGGLTDESSADLARYATGSDIPKVNTADGKEIQLPSIQIDTELAQGFLGLPGIEEWNSALNRFVLAVNRSGLTADTLDMGRRFFDNFFRTSLLAFRVSYIVRNTAEMQVRMFLNGHHSLLSDPLTMMGMTLGNFADAKAVSKYRERWDKVAEDLLAETGKKPTKAEIEAIVGPRKQSVLGQMFAPFRQTVLGTDFEVGTDEALAAANFVEDYFSLTRLAHSLTDPRVYNTAVRTGWRSIGYGTPSFNQGWAHELIMLHRSGIARLVVEGPDRRYAGIANVMGRMSDEDLKVRALMEAPEYEDLRMLLIGADENFKTILSDVQATKEYLFTSPNSVQNRVMEFTAGNPQLLEFIRNGTLKYGVGTQLSINRIPDPNQRIKSLATILSEHFNGTQGGFNWAEHFVSKNVQVPWVENIDRRPGISIFNKFFDVANKIERLGAVGPEFRMAYWDKMAELAPGLRAGDVDRAMKAARSTLSPLKRLSKDGKFDAFGKGHPAFAALRKAKAENSDGLLTLDEIHGIASSYAAEEVTKLFYDASRRNNFWYSLRLLFPFGQAWGNTIQTWTRLGTKSPIQVYKAQKALNALIESDSNAVYELGSQVGAYGQYAPGFAPWEQDTNGGFFYTDQFGETSFMYPVVGRAAALPLNVWGSVVGAGSPGAGELAMQSPASSLNLALGADNIFPGVGPLAVLPLATGVLPDNEITASIRQIAAPFGEKDIIETMVPSWFSKIIGGVGAIPVLGDIVGPWVDALSPANKNKHLRDAMMILSTSGNYADWATNDKTARQLRDDSAGLAKAMLLTTGLFQNVLPSTPYVQTTTQLAADEMKGALEAENTALYTVSMMNSLFQQYRARNGYDDSAAREEWVKDFGPAALFATTGDWKNLSRVPTSQALDFARKNPEIAKANLDTFTLFFPQGDSSDVAAISWIRKHGVGDRERKSKDDIFKDVIGFLERVQRLRIDSMEANGFLNGAEAEAAREDLKNRYIETGVVSGVFVDKQEEMQKLKAFVDRYPQIQSSQGGKAFMEAWVVRQVALDQVRQQTGRTTAGLGSKAAVPVLQWYLGKIDEIEAKYPDFKLLAGKFRREWE